MNSDKRLLIAWKNLNPEKRGALLEGLDADEQAFMLDHWPLWARPEQLAPISDWTTWLMLGGRGAGKTRAGAEWVKSLALGRWPGATQVTQPIALIGETFADAREVMVEGVSGILSVHQTGERPTWTPSRNRLEWPNGAVAQLFSADDPDALRGPQFSAAWCDEIAKWRYAEQTWDMLQFGLRLGERPRQLATTTPRPVPLVKRLLADSKTVVSRMATHDNRANLANNFFDEIVSRYQGTKLGRQELDGELIEDRSDALWNRSALEAGRIARLPPLERIIVAIDPPVTSHAKSDACGIIAVGKSGEQAIVLDDASIDKAKPLVWAKQAVALYHKLGADCLLAEVNQGGEMVTTIIAQIDASVPVKSVRAKRGKWTRAEPVAALYEQGRVVHAGIFGPLEDEMCDFGPDGRSGGHSPDRVDALVWAVSELMLATRSQPKLLTF